MTGPMNDEQLLGLVAASLDDDQPPAEVMEAAYAAFGWRTLDADLARLIDDSEPEVVGFQHGAVPSRVLAFETGYGVIEVAVAADGFEVVVRPAPVRVVLRRPDLAIELPLPDPASDPPSATMRVPGPGGTGSGGTGSGGTGPARIEVTWTSGRAVTPWMTL